MYSPDIIDRRLHQARKTFFALKLYPRDESIAISARLELLRRDKHSKPLPEGELARPLLPSEQQFIDNERLLCKCNFEYYFTRYHHLSLDAGVMADSLPDPIAPPTLAESQRRIITMLGRREKDCYAEFAKHKFTLGILAYIHKVRQIMATATVGAMKMHRMLFWPGTRCLSATLDAPRVSELFRRDQLAISRLPFWMRTSTIYPDVKDTELGFPSPVDSYCSYQAENAETGIGVGSQTDVSHLTEVALWKHPGQISYSFVPSIPKSRSTLHVQESTADGKGYWQTVTEDARHHRSGYESWVYIFIPWYMNKLKYRDIPPDGWSPTDYTLRHAALCEKTSPEFFDGRTVLPTRHQLYWWEKMRAQHARRGELAIFLTNYPATPEQSFQSSEGSALPVELIEEMEQDTSYPESCFDVDLEPVA